MTELVYLAVVAAGLAGLLATIAIWAPRPLWTKVTALSTTTLMLPAAYVGFVQLLSLPKPVTHEWWLSQADEATVLGSSAQEDVAIYLWLQLEGADEPRAYALPWSRELAEQLQEAQREAEEQQSELRMRVPFEPSLDELEPRFYALPQPAPPPKQPDPPAPQIYAPPPLPGHDA
jgi:hypothetical protein